jgi:hypothetical protein
VQTVSAETLNPSDLAEAARKIMLSESWVHNPDDLALLNMYYRVRDNAVRQANYAEQTRESVVTRSAMRRREISKRAEETSVSASVAHRKARAFSSPFPMRVYTSRTDRTGTVLCPVHRSEFFAIHQGACSDGRLGQRCEMCPGGNI